MIKNMRLIALAIICLLPNVSIAQQTEVPNFLCSDFQFVWESDNVLEVPESVFYDEENKCIYVSNIKGTPSGQDGNGYISKLNTAGKVIVQKWITGLDAPKGMAKHGNLLYVSDINDLIIIDIAKSKIIKKYPAKEAQFLNDVTVDSKSGIVYVSDSSAETIYQLKEDSFTKWLSDEKLAHVNGLYFENNTLYVGVLNKIVSIESGNKLINTIVNNTGSIDGLIRVDPNSWITSDWVGNIQLIKSGKVKKLLSSAEQQINAADLGYIPDQKIVLVPTFHNNRVVAYQLK